MGNSPDALLILKIVINAGIENSRREIIPKSGHLIPIEQPGLFNESVLNFLGKLSNLPN